MPRTRLSPNVALAVVIALSVVIMPLSNRPARAGQPSSAQDRSRADARNVGAAGEAALRNDLPVGRRGEPSERDFPQVDRSQPIPIPPPGPAKRGERRADPQKSTRGNVAAVVLSSLAIVLGLFFLVVWLSRRALPKSSSSLPTDVLEVLGRSPLASRHHLQLVRLGRRLLLVSVTPENAQTLAEITDPDEVDHLAGLCQQNQAGSISATFRQVLHQLGSQPAGSPTRERKTSVGLDLTTTGELPRR